MNKNKVVFANLYIDYTYPESMSNEDAQKELMHKLKTLAVLNKDLTVKLITNPEPPDYSNSVYLP